MAKKKIVIWEAEDNDPGISITVTKVEAAKLFDGLSSAGELVFACSEDLVEVLDEGDGFLYLVNGEEINDADVDHLMSELKQFRDSTVKKTVRKKRKKK